MWNTKACKLVKTKDNKGNKNGLLMEIASTRDGWSKFLDNAQVYVTIVDPGKKKGFHLHHKKTNQFTLIKGKALMAVWDGQKIKERQMSSDKPKTVRVPKKQAVAFYNYGKEAAYILNLCSPPYDPEDREQEDLDLDWKPSI